MGGRALAVHLHPELLPKQRWRRWKKAFGSTEWLQELQKLSASRE